MIIIPAIDLKHGRCVRLFQGEMDQETVYFENPMDAARHWVEQGATLIHIVDLDGAVEGRPVHTGQVEEICRRVARDLRNQYTLGYSPENKKEDGGFRKIAVKLVNPPKNAAKVEPKTRDGYFAPGPR